MAAPGSNSAVRTRTAFARSFFPPISAPSFKTQELFRMSSRPFSPSLRARGRLAGSIVAVASTLAACGSQREAAPHDDATVQSFEANAINGQSFSQGTLALSFDDGPGERTGELLDYLRKEGIIATFFVQGNKASQRMSLLARMKAEGHLVANHTWTHPHMTKAADPVSEIARAHTLIEPYVLGRSFLFRAPYADWNSGLSRLLNQAGYLHYVGHVGWDIDGGDWECWKRDVNLSVKACADRYIVRTQAKGRGIVLMHDSDLSNKTVDMVKELVPRWKELGYRFARVDDASGVSRLVQSAGGRPGLRNDSDRYEPPRPVPTAKPTPPPPAPGPVFNDTRACPSGTIATPIGSGGLVCARPNATVVGPFPPEMQRACTEAGGRVSQCAGMSWTLGDVSRFWGRAPCPAGTQPLANLGVCSDGTNVYGPFSDRQVYACEKFSTWDCRSMRWSLSFLRGLPLAPR
jgi:peptidoglycan/xylan/chitin deacetylase (PgdA/CDA1 family)